MGVFGRDRLAVTLFMGLALLASPMIGRALAADAGSSTPPAVGQAAPVGGKTFAPSRAWKLAFAAGSTSLTRGVKADSLIQLAQSVISVTPNTVNTGASNTVTITTSGFFDLSQVTPSQIQLRPADGVSNFAITEQSAQHLALSRRQAHRDHRHAQAQGQPHRDDDLLRTLSARERHAQLRRGRAGGPQRPQMRCGLKGPQQGQTLRPLCTGPPRRLTRRPCGHGQDQLRWGARRRWQALTRHLPAVPSRERSRR